jgi:protein-S-isoprenylcysteine O-methyltransferase Ste14
VASSKGTLPDSPAILRSVAPLLPPSVSQIAPTPAASALLVFTLIAFFVSDFLAVWKASGNAQLTPSGGERDRGSYIAIQVTTLLGLFGAVVMPQVAPGLSIPGPVWIPVALGMAIAWFGICLRIWAILTLGRSFQRVVTVEADQEVITSGPYRYVRHPAYTGVLAAFAGMGFMLCNFGSVIVVAVVPLIGYVVRIVAEEKALREALGDAYSSYADSRARLVPGVW